MARSELWYTFPAPPRPVMNGFDDFDEREEGGRREGGPDASEPRVTAEGARVKLPAPPRPVWM
jgi:hypothetical protein